MKTTLTLLAGILLSSPLLAGSGGAMNIVKKPNPTAEIIKPDPQLAAAVGSTFILGQHNTISIVGPIGQDTASDFISALSTIKGDEVVIYLDSPGGSVIAGNSMITSMASSGKTFNCVAKFAASMAFGILQACDNRYLTRDGIIMQHTMSYGLRGSAPQNRSLVGLFQRIEDEMDRFQAERLGLTLEEFRYKTIRDYWLYSVDAVTANAADGLAIVSCEEALVNQKVIRTFRGFFGTFKLKMSACPLILKAEPVNERKGRRSVDLDDLKDPQLIKKLNAL